MSLVGQRRTVAVQMKMDTLTNTPLNALDATGGGGKTREQVPVGRPQLRRHVRRRTIAGTNLSKATKGVKLGLHLHDKLTPRG